MLYALLLLIGIILIVAVFIKKTYKIEREIIIDQPVGRVFDYILFLKHQLNFNKWWMIDKEVKMDFKGEDGKIGAIVCWDSTNKQLGKGEQVIKAVELNHRIDFEIRFVSPFSNKAQIYMITEPITDDITRFKWGFNGGNKFPLTIMNPLMDKLLGNDIATSAANLKKILEFEIGAQ